MSTPALGQERRDMGLCPVASIGFNPMDESVRAIISVASEADIIVPRKAVDVYRFLQVISQPFFVRLGIDYLVQFVGEVNGRHYLLTAFVSVKQFGYFLFQHIFVI